MSKLIISRDQQVVRQVELGERRMTIGRHPDNDIVIANGAVSARHAAITRSGDKVMLEDLGSSNGTFVNGQRVAQAMLAPGDRAAIATYEVQFVTGEAASDVAPLGCIEILNGASAGKTLSLLKPLTTLGSPGVLVVVISRHADAYYIAQVQGEAVARINDDLVSPAPRALRHGDVLELTGTRMRFAAKNC
jgi:hypothetical protein